MTSSMSIPTYVEQLRSAMKEIYQDVFVRIHADAQKFLQNQREKGEKSHGFKIGDWVFLKRSPIAFRSTVDTKSSMKTGVVGVPPQNKNLEKSIGKYSWFSLPLDRRFPKSALSYKQTTNRWIEGLLACSTPGGVGGYSVSLIASVQFAGSPPLCRFRQTPLTTSTKHLKRLASTLQFNISNTTSENCLRQLCRSECRTLSSIATSMNKSFLL